MTILTLLCIFALTIPLTASADCRNIIVRTTRGDVIGCHYNYGYPLFFWPSLYYGSGDVFLGIPFAQPPVGTLRFSQPQRLDKFANNPYNATFFRPACPQYEDSYIPVREMSEDCLQLNVFSPNVYSSAKLPVMVFVHGGSLQQGHAARYTPEGIIHNLVSRGVVVVTIQYRLNVLGFFTTFTEEFPPNRGMLDQVEALKFVREEIANFGGDPLRITLFGQSSGAASVSAHILSPLSQNLFQQAIIQSGGLLASFDSAIGFSAQSQRWALQLCNFSVEDWQTGNFSELKECLDGMNYTKWLPLEATNSGWSMMLDGYFLPDSPQRLAELAPSIPVIYGMVADEWAEMDLISLANNQTTLSNYTRSYSEALFKATNGFLGDKTDEILRIVESVYVPAGTADDDHLAWLKINSKILWPMAAIMGREIDLYVKRNSSQLYLYEFTYPSDIGRPFDLAGWQPVFHTEEIPFIFMQRYFWEPAVALRRATMNDFAMADFMGKTWTDFAKYGKPTLCDGWRSTRSTANKVYLEITSGTKRMRQNWRQLDQLLWNRIVPAVIGNDTSQ